MWIWKFLLAFLVLMTLNPLSLNNTNRAERDNILFNRIERAGSESMAELLTSLSKLNDFSMYRNLPQPFRWEHITDNQEDELDFVDQFITTEGVFAYIEHINWINFTDYDLPRPIYVNMIRHPIEKVMSAYYYLRHPHTYTNHLVAHPQEEEKERPYFDTPFNECAKRETQPHCLFDGANDYNSDWRRLALKFCGNRKICKKFNSQAATQLAKQNIEREYAVVGSWEETNITLSVLEHYIPRFFRGATKVFYESEKKENFHMNATPHNTNLDPEVKAKLNMQFSFEIELYNFCKQRLYKQYIAIKKDELMQKFN